MLKLESWADLFKYNKELLDDDFNHGQQLVVKVKQTSDDGVSEANDTFKQSTPSEDGTSAVSFEAKLKTTHACMAQEYVIKQDGSANFDIKCSRLEKLTNIKGLRTWLSGAAYAVPTSKAPEFKVGIDFSNNKAKARWNINTRTLLAEASATYLARDNLVVGLNLLLDPKTQNLQKYDFGVSWAPADKAFVGLKHESLNKDALEFGKFFLFFQHAATLSQTVGTEFILDWQKRVLDARLGLWHKFNDDTSSKVKVNHHGFLDALIKHRVNGNVTVIATTGFNLRAVVAEQKAKSLPLGLALDLKL
jgi:hypothetical protein